MSTTPRFGEVISELNNNDRQETIVLGGGCFWCTEAVFIDIEGVERVVSGYAGGSAETANYEAVCTKGTDHVEVILVEFDPQVIGRKEILEIFFAAHDPTTPNRQGNDVGPQYRSAIFYTSDEQKAAAEELIADLVPDLYGKQAVTDLIPFTSFYPAEEYHQNYYTKVGDRNSYCTFVISPKVGKIRKKYSHRLKSRA
ncbi:peptide-methionine (S)-S-oxide reductase [Neolewinella xylanilytica]|uniref:Peptide methionine sulfoxide reductase MsrA n=1 Tax=Neolewinella xylanilytica TaxID=1514080 RepID=A0A2S6I071_9BACT|nr:peptide-methionine (S)-S-oxide reductase MsrA [Neolewinella xylanilytica]PPK84263.1 peptide-methionine (S)-S-oxide reductase [Neolewinella xylanilytica]